MPSVGDVDVVTTAIDILSQGLSYGSILLLSAMGFTIIYGVMGVVNLAHGEFVMLGAYMSLLLMHVLPAVIAIAGASLLVGIIGLVIDRAIIRWLYQNPIKSMLGTFALGMIVRQLVVLTWGPGLQTSSVPVAGTINLGFGADIAVWRVCLIATATITASCLAVWLARSQNGLQIRITASDVDVAKTLGTNVGLVSATTFGIGAALAGLAGALIAPLNSVSPDMGVQYLVGAFLVVVLAGLGNVRGAVYWSAAVGVLTTAIAVAFDDVVAQVAIWTAALLMVSLRKRSDARV